MTGMNDRSGIYGLLDPSGKVQREQFQTAPFPPPRQTTGPYWSALWPAGGEDTAYHHEGERSLAFIGELYNIPALRRQLGAPDDISPGQLLLLAHARWSIDFLDKLDGQFVLALRDGNCLHLYRDLSGARSLYYTAQRDGLIAYASTLEILFHLPGVEKQLARRSLHEYLRFLEIAAPNTLFEGVYALEAGKLLSWTAGRHDTRRLAGGDQTQDAAPGFNEALDTLDGLLNQSAGNRLKHAARPAAFLSGGVDSSLLCALAARINPEVTAITVGFDNPEYDESAIAEHVAKHLGIRHRILRFTRQDCHRAFEDFAHGAEQPSCDPAAPPTLLAFEHCLNHFDTVLDGSGADESFGMMPPRHVRVGVEYAALLPAGSRRAIASAMRRLPVISGYTPIFDFEHPAELMLRWRGFSRLEIESLCGEPASLEHTLFYQTFNRFPRQAHFERYSALVDAVTSDRLHQASAMTGLSVRYPYWDHAVDHFIRSLPVNYRYQPNEPKRMLRALLARYVPQALWDAPKRGFGFPLLEFLSNEDFLLVRRYLHRDRWAQSAILSPELVEDYGRRFMAGEKRLMFRVWALVVLAAWLETHLE
jgi:asparagine synthase (glutamine-hydrolysing)